MVETVRASIYIDGVEREAFGKVKVDRSVKQSFLNRWCLDGIVSDAETADTACVNIRTQLVLFEGIDIPLSSLDEDREYYAAMEMDLGTIGADLLERIEREKHKASGF